MATSLAPSPAHLVSSSPILTPPVQTTATSEIIKPLAGGAPAKKKASAARPKSAPAAPKKEKKEPATKKKAKAQAGGSCGCADAKQTGGSLASDAVVGLVDEKSWVSMNMNATNQFAPFQTGGARQSFFSNVASAMNIPLFKGGGSLNELLVNNLGGNAKKTFTKTSKFVNAESSTPQQGGGSSSLLDGVESLTNLFSPSIKASATAVQHKVLSGGYGGPAELVNRLLSELTPAGAVKLGELLNDKKLFKSGTSLKAYALDAVTSVPSAKAHSIAKQLAQQHGGSALEAFKALEAANLDKVAAILGHKSGAALADDVSSLFGGAKKVGKRESKKKA